MGVKNALLGRGKEKAATDPLIIERLLEAMKSRLGRIAMIDSNATWLMEQVDQGEYEDPDYSKISMIRAGQQERTAMQQQRFERSTVFQSSHGLEISITNSNDPSLGRVRTSRSLARAFDTGYGEGFPIMDEDVVTGKIDNVTLRLTNGTLGEIELISAATPHWSERSQTPDTHFTVGPIFAPNATGILVPTVEIQLV